MEVIGYARPERDDPASAARQRGQLVDAGATRVTVEAPASPAAVRTGRDRPRLDALIAAAHPGQTLMVTSMDRLARSLPHLLDVVESITARGAHVVFLAEAISTTGAQGEAVTSTLLALAELERVLRAARTATARAVAPRGRGRPRVVSPAQVARARAMLEAGTGPTAIAAALGITRPTLHRYLHPPAIDVDPPP